MKFIIIALAIVTLLWTQSAYGQTFEFTWESRAWTKTYETPTEPVVSGPFTLTGNGNATFAEIAGGGAQLSFDGGHGGRLVANGDGSFNGPMTFRTATNETRSGLAVLTPTADGFTVTVTRAASGPDAGAAFAGAGTHAASGTRQAVSASEPFTAAMTLAGLVSAGLLSRRRRV